MTDIDMLDTQGEVIAPITSTALFNGKDLSGWIADEPLKDAGEDTRDIFFVSEGLLVSQQGTVGHLVTESSYRNYRLEFEYRLRPGGGNGSVLVHVSQLRVLRTKSKNWFPRAIEIKLRTRDAGDVWCLVDDIEVADMERLRPRAEGQKWGGGEQDARHILKLADAEKPGGEWNSFVLEARERTIKAWLNDVLVVDGFNCTVDRGRVSLQAGNHEVGFRNVIIGPLG
jgi:hypothetical protein